MGMLAFLNNNEKDKNMFEEDIDQILEQRTRINTNLEVFSNITYSKTSFASNAHSNNQIDINDPNFWNKVLPQESVTLGILQQLEENLEQIQCNFEEQLRFVEKLQEHIIVFIRSKVIEHKLNMDDQVNLLKCTQVISQSENFHPMFVRAANFWLE